MTNLGIRYCGGCNPQYDRSRAVSRLLAAFPDVTPVYDTGCYCPVWLNISGCPKACAAETPLRAGTMLSASTEKEVLALRPKLAALLTETSGPDKRVLSRGMTASRTRRFTETDILNFAALTGDRNGLHLDPAIADQTIFRQPIAHGILVSSLFSAILGCDLPGTGTILMDETIRYLAPVFPGDIVTATISFDSYTERPSCYIGTFTGSCKKEDGTEVISGTFRELMNKRLFLVQADA